MANQTLIRQAEKMYGSMADTTDYASLLTQPFVDQMEKNLKEQEEKTEAAMATMPAGVNIDKVPEELRGIVTNYLTENKSAYVEAAKVVGSGIKATDPRYIEAIEEMNRIRGGFEALDANLVKLQENRKLSLDNIDNVSPGANPWNTTLQHKFGNGSIYGELTLRDGNFYYKGEKGEEINTNDYRLAIQQSTRVTDDMQKWHGDSRSAGKEGYDFDKGMYRGNIKSLLKKVGKDGRVDFAFSGLYGDESGQTEFIDKWIAEKHGVTDGDEFKLEDGTVVKSNPKEFKTLYESLKNEKFDSKSDIGRALEDYLVNTVEESYNTGVAAKRERDRKNNLTKTDYGREFGGIWRSDQLIREKTTAANNQQPFWDFEGTKWNPIGGDMFKDEDGNKKNKFDIAVDNDFPMQLMTGENPGYTPTTEKDVESDDPIFIPIPEGTGVGYEKNMEIQAIIDKDLSEEETKAEIAKIIKKYEK